MSLSLSLPLTSNHLVLHPRRPLRSRDVEEKERRCDLQFMRRFCHTTTGRLDWREGMRGEWVSNVFSCPCHRGKRLSGLAHLLFFS